MINKVTLIGHVGRDPEIRHLDNNVTVARFSVATSESYKNKNGEKVTNTEWHNIVLWRGLADVAEKFVKKGALIYIDGKLRSNTWDDKDGNKRTTVEIYGENFQLLGRSSENSGAGLGSGSSESHASHDQSAPHEQNNAIPDLSPTDDLPF